MFHRSGGVDPGRDGCRAPFPWSGGAPPVGFSPADAVAPPWLPQPAHWASRTVAAEAGDPSSMLELYRAALRIRRQEEALRRTGMRWIGAPDGGLAFARGDTFACVVNLSAGPVDLPAHREVLLHTAPM